ncbi:MAG: VWA domain-containing protein [Acidobacteriota bacterium]
MMLRRAAILTLTTLLAATSLAAQEGEFSSEISVNLVLVPVVVRDSRGGFVSGLEADDFRLTVDGKPVEIETFDAGADAPMSLVFLQDLSGSMGNGGKLEASQRTLTYFLARAQEGDELALASFASGRLGIDIPFTHDLSVFREAMALWKPYGTTALHDAVAWIPEISDDGRHPKRAVVLVTDGVDNASTLTPALARNMVQKARLPVYILGLGEGSPTAEGTFAPLLQRLARATGGRFFSATSPSDISRASVTVIGELRSQFVLGFHATSSGPRAYRPIRVEAKKRSYRVTHRQGYRGGPPAP